MTLSYYRLKGYNQGMKKIATFYLLFIALGLTRHARAVINATNTHINSVVNIVAAAGCTNVEITVNYDDDADAPFDNGTSDWFYFVVYDGNDNAIAIDDATAFSNHRVGQQLAINDSFPANPVSWPFTVRIWDTDGNVGYTLASIEAGILIDEFTGIDPTGYANCGGLPNASATPTPTNTPPPTSTPAPTATPTTNPCVFTPGFYEFESSQFLSCATYDVLDVYLSPSNNASGGQQFVIPVGETVSWQIEGTVIVIFRRIGNPTFPHFQEMEFCFNAVCELVDNSNQYDGLLRFRHPVAFGTNVMGVYDVSVLGVTNDTYLDSFLVLDTDQPVTPEATPEIVVMFPPPDPTRYYQDIDGLTVAIDLVISAGEIIVSVLLFALFVMQLMNWTRSVWTK